MDLSYAGSPKSDKGIKTPPDWFQVKGNWDKYVDETLSPSLFEKGPKDIWGNIAVKVKKKEKVNHDTYLY